MRNEQKRMKPYSANYAFCTVCKEHPTEHRTGVCVHCRRAQRRKEEERMKRMRSEA